MIGGLALAEVGRDHAGPERVAVAGGEVVGEGGELVRVPRREGDVVAPRGEAAGDGDAEAAGGADDEHAARVDQGRRRRAGAEARVVWDDRPSWGFLVRGLHRCGGVARSRVRGRGARRG